MPTKALRTWVFIDGQNCYNDARRAFHHPRDSPQSGQIHPMKLAELLVQKGQANDGRPRELERVLLYKGLPSPKHDPRSYGAHRRQKSVWIGWGVKVFDRPIRYPQDYPKTPAIEKGVDVALAVDLVYNGLRRFYDQAIIFSTDTDLIPALEVLRDLYRAWGEPRLEVASWQPSRKRLRLDGVSLWCHLLDKADYAQVQDFTDYRSPKS
jgi:uncharacterized LabA/DUF88 family protein